ncbi:MAG: hypothetical protein SCH66_02265 [Methanolobus sp.]|nr:hypothetical protein [Methanolobus sp.]
MNKKVPYQKQSVMWSYALLLKARELAQYLVEKRKTNEEKERTFLITDAELDALLEYG